MNREALRCLLCVLVLIGVGSFTSVYAQLRDWNLIEFSYGLYAERSQRALIWPPFVKIYQDGKLIHYEGEENGRYLLVNWLLSNSIRSRSA